MNLSTKQKQTHRHREQTHGCQEGGEAGKRRQFGINRCIPHIERMDTQESPTV